MLRRESQDVGLPRDFAIYDDDDQSAAVKRASMQLDLSDRGLPASQRPSQISHAKNHGITRTKCDRSAQSTTRPQEVAKIFRAYEEILRKAAALDFDDLLLRAVELLREECRPCARPGTTGFNT